MFSILKNEGFTYVSPEILYEMFNYLKGVKRPGCEDQFFVEQGDLIHKEMMVCDDVLLYFLIHKEMMVCDDVLLYYT
ncbi:hypothetical protein DPMN_178351 [Dreissena polymorpha]|uniref:Uncharacterized protein n=1 Tax=Dreissena polymorpha TaxID=45954 RepID=A0A9D4ILC1_DREPO|nr:hypothetical protein DPMN_178351 [Dreissena polymorpha]